MNSKEQIKRILRLAKKIGISFEETVRGLQSLTNVPPEVIRKELEKALNEIQTHKN